MSEHSHPPEPGDALDLILTGAGDFVQFVVGLVVVVAGLFVIIWFLVATGIWTDYAEPAEERYTTLDQDNRSDLLLPTAQVEP